MAKAVMISIRPRWCDKIAYRRDELGWLIGMPGPKKEEVRKTAPKLPVPFTCYIYCTKDNDLYSPGEKFFVCDYHGQVIHEGNGQVIGEFICNGIRRYSTSEAGAVEQLSRRSCVPPGELVAYAGDSGVLYGWGISSFTLYDKPKTLGEFCKPCDPDPQCDCRYCKTHGRSLSKRLLRPPQSWCYVEEVTGR